MTAPALGKPLKDEEQKELIKNLLSVVQGWRSGESTCLLPMWPGFVFSLGVKRGLSLLVLYSSPRGFSPSTPVFPSPQKTTFD